MIEDEIPKPRVGETLGAYLNRLARNDRKQLSEHFTKNKVSLEEIAMNSTSFSEFLERANEEEE